MSPEPADPPSGPSTAEEVGELLFRSARYETHPAFREALASVAQMGLLWGGTTGLVGVLLYGGLHIGLLGTPTTWSYADLAGPSAEIAMPTLLLVGIVCALLVALGRASPPLWTTRLAMAGAIVVVTGIVAYDTALSDGRLTDYLGLIYVVGVVTVPFRPGQVLGLGAGLVGLVALIGIPNPLVGSVGGGLPVVYSQLVFVCILSVLLTGVSGVLYGRHWSRIRSQEALAENRRLLHETETLAKIGGWSIDLRSGEARATPQVYDIFGVDPRQSLSPETMARQFPPDVRAALETAFERCREEGVPYHLVLPLDEEADETRWVRVHGTARTVEGQVVEILGAVQDVTWHRRREQETKEQQALLHAVTENVSEGIYRSHPDEGLVYANPAFADLFGYDSVDALLNVESPELYADPDVRAELAERLHEQGTLEGEEVRYRRADGSEFIGRLTSTLVRGEDGTPKYYDGIVADITERKRRERTLRKAKERAEEANRIKSSLLSTMNHEFRTPLTSILSFAEVVERDPSLADEFIGRIRSGGTRLLRTLNTVMDFARLEGNEMDPTPQSLDVTEIAAAVVDDFRPDAERRDLGLQLNRPDEAVEVVLDPHALERVYTHLVSNALKFTKAGRVTVGAREDGDVVELWVRDTGIGIDPADRPAILDEFTQASSGADRTHEGNGLGLTIVKRLTERMGGSVEIDSAVGEGTCVTVRVPKTDPSARSSAQSGSGLASAEET